MVAGRDTRVRTLIGPIAVVLTAAACSGGSALVAFDSVCATAYDDAVLYRVAVEP